MEKAKKARKLNSDAVYSKKAEAAKSANPFARSGATAHAAKKMNPFEIHVNKEKFQILGRTCKHDKGLPGVSRAKAVKKRKETLGREFRDKHKTNQFKDRRIGKNYTGDELNEGLLNARFLAEKVSEFKQNKMSRFNLNDDEVLTHRGQTLEEIEQFRDERSDEEDGEDEVLNANFTEVAHFGGDNEQQKDRKTAIEEMIVEQKRRKAEVAKDKDEVFNLTEKLDTNYKGLIGLMGKMTKSELNAKAAPDDYDKAMREMIFEPRGVVTDKLLSEEEAAQQEKERLENLERARLTRMRGEGEDEEQKPKHRSADDLDDGYFAYGAEEEEEGTLAYNMEGQLDNNSKGGKNSNQNEEDVNSEANTFGDGEEGSDIVESAEEEEDDDGDSDEENADNLSDLKDSGDDSEEEKEKQLKAVAPKQKKLKSVAAPERLELPFIVEMPSSYEDFTSLIKAHKPEDQGTLVERLIKCNHPKLDGVNREKVVQLFTYLLTYINELFVDASSEDVSLHFQILSHLNPLLYDLLHLNPEKMSQIMLNIIQERYAEFRKNSKTYPSLEIFVLLKLVSNFFSTSDFRHPVVTPCFLFAQHILSKARIRTRQDIAMGLFLVTIMLEYTQQSHRFLPAAWNFLLGIIYLAVPKRPIEVFKILPPFQSTSPLNKLLALAEDPTIATLTEQLMTSEDLVTTTLTTDFKVRALHTALKLINDGISGGLSKNIGVNYIASPLLEMLERLPLALYPEYVQKTCAQCKSALEELAAKPLTKLVPPEKKPKALRLLEPRIETVYDDKRRPKMTQEKEERAKLMHKLKRETKGAVREIRRDTEFLQKIRIQQHIKNDMERKEKVKRIYQEASVQQGELNELARAKKKKKF